MADDSDENDTQTKINEEDRDLEAKRFDTSQKGRPDWQEGSSSPEGGRPIGEFAYQGQAAMGEALGGGPEGTGSTGAELPGGAQSEFARTSGGQTGGVTAAPSFGNPATGAGGAQGGAVGSAGEDNEYGARASEEERAEEEERSA
jgi:hypothetical protein